MGIKVSGALVAFVIASVIANLLSAYIAKRYLSDCNCH